MNVSKVVHVVVVFLASIVLLLFIQLHVLKDLSPIRHFSSKQTETVALTSAGQVADYKTGTRAIATPITKETASANAPASSANLTLTSARTGQCLTPRASTTQHSDSESSTWKEKTFCHDFLLDTYHDDLPMCGHEVTKTDQVKCYGSVYCNHLALCSYKNLALQPQKMIGVIPNDATWKKPADKTINFLQSTEFSCPSSSVDRLSKKTDRDDFELKLTQHLLQSEKLSPSVCDVWINKTTLFHVSNSLHIYFRFLDLYNVYKALFDNNLIGKDHLVLRIGSMSKGYRFPEFDKALFPGELTLADLQANNTVCFKEVIFVPRSYHSIPFRCKMESLLRKRCFECSGRGLTGSPLYTFRSRVLKACNITDDCAKTNRIVVVSRKPYKRWSSDDPKKFQRILNNEDEMVSKIRKTFPKVTVNVIHMEDLDVCEQVRYAVEADVMIGVHGAGLVHFWWLRDEATALELEPSFEAGNPSFRMLTKLAGRNYESERILGTSKGVTVKVDQVLKKLKKYL